MRLIISIIITSALLSGCAGLGQLCEMHHGYIGTIDGKVVRVMPTKCAVLGGAQ